MSAAAQILFNSAHLPYGVGWAAVRKLGSIASELRPGGTVRYRVVIKHRGKTYRIDRWEVADGVFVPFSSRQDAEFVLEGIRTLVAAQRVSIPRAISKFLPTFTPEDLIENRMAEYIDHFQGLVDGGKRSPSTLREIVRYAAPGGHFSYWSGTSVRGLTFGHIEDWHRWLGGRGIGLKTQKNVSDSFRAFLRRLKRRGEVEGVPEFPPIEVPEHAPTIITLEQQQKILNAIPWERRGLFLCAAKEALRLGELRALDLGDYSEGKLRVTKTIQDKGRKERIVPVTKNRSAETRELWSRELIEWLDWRVEQATPEARLRGEVALFPNPTARNPAKRWGDHAAREEWNRACDEVWIYVSLQDGTRHCILTVLAHVLPERMLQAFSRHRDAKSLDHYAKPRVTKAAIRRITELEK